jgi:hypothetical protein
MPLRISRSALHSPHKNESLADEALANNQFQTVTTVKAIAFKNTIAITNVKSDSEITVFDSKGVLVKKMSVNSDTNFTMPSGLWIVKIKSEKTITTCKLITQ